MCMCVSVCVLCVCVCRYVSEHTVAFWAASYVQDLARSTRSHVAMKCYGLGLGLDTFR
jgi:trehalose 6-phosphate synthase/phosphatase